MISSNIDLARRALDAGSADIEVAAYAGYTLGWCGEEVDRALNILRSATDRCPSFAWAWASLGMLEGLQGDPSAGIEPADRAIQLSPRDPMAFRAYIAKACALKFSERFDDFIPTARAALDVHPGLPLIRIQLVEALFATGDIDGMTRVRRELLARTPEITISRYLAACQHYRNFRIHETETVERLRAADIPE